MNELDRRDEALLSYDAALGLRPRNAQPHLARANTLVELARFDEALSAFDRAIEVDPDFDPAFVNRGVLNLLRGDYRNGLADMHSRNARRTGDVELAARGSGPDGMQVETLGEHFDEGPDAFLDSAAVIANLDLVICSCTSIAHLAGAPAAPTRVALKPVLTQMALELHQRLSR